MSRLIFIFLLMPFTMLQANADISNGDITNGDINRDEIKNHFEIIKTYLPEAQALGELQGKPPAAGIYDARHNLIGYAYYADDVIKIPAYSGKLIHTLVVFDVLGQIVGIKIISHQEPILLVGISEQDLKNFTDQYAGKNIGDKIKIDGEIRDGYASVDSISGATITVMVINESLTRSVSKVAASRGVNVQRMPEKSPEEPPSMWRSVWRDKVIAITLLLSAIILLMIFLKRRG